MYVPPRGVAGSLILYRTGIYVRSKSVATNVTNFGDIVWTDSGFISLANNVQSSIRAVTDQWALLRVDLSGVGPGMFAAPLQPAPNVVMTPTQQVSGVTNFGIFGGVY